MSEVVKSVMTQLLEYITKEGAGLKVELIGSWLWITGDTKPHKDFLKSIGCTWHKKKTCWVYHEEPCRRYGKKDMAMEDIKMNHGCIRLV